MCEISTRNKDVYVTCEVCAFKEATRKYAFLMKKRAALGDGIECEVRFAPQRLPLDGTVSVLGEISIGL